MSVAIRLFSGLCCSAILLSGARVSARPYPFTAPPVDQVLDLHGNPARAQLVIFAAGNQYMVMPRLLAAFRERYPAVHAIFYETLPPGIIVHQLQSGGLAIGNLEIDKRPDVILTGANGIRTLQRRGTIDAWYPYASNVLAILVRAGNPLGIHSLTALGRPGIRVVMPNPHWEGVAERIEGAYAKAGGAALVRTIMVTKVAAGTTILTHIHHRETPLLLRENRADAGPVWRSEALFQAKIPPVLGMVAIPASQNVRTIYDAAAVRGAAHAGAAAAFVRFLLSPQARAIFRSYGFGPPH